MRFRTTSFQDFFPFTACFHLHASWRQVCRFQNGIEMGRTVCDGNLGQPLARPQRHSDGPPCRIRSTPPAERCSQVWGKCDRCYSGRNKFIDIVRSWRRKSALCAMMFRWFSILSALKCQKMVLASREDASPLSSINLNFSIPVRAWWKNNFN